MANKGPDKVLTTLSSYKEWKKHIVLMHESKIWDVAIIPAIRQFAETFRPSSFFGIELDVENTLWTLTWIAKDRLTTGYATSNIPRKEALANLRRAHEEEI